MNRHEQNILFSDRRKDWGTPDVLFARLNTLYHFDLDVAADDDNARCAKYFTIAHDGLAQSWRGARVWCNPPYGRDIQNWVRKAAMREALFTVMLVPVRTDTQWWHLAMQTARVEFLKGRLRFKGASASAPFPSALLFWDC